MNQMTDEEKFTMYARLTKRELISMLIEANKHLNSRQPTVVYPSNQGLTVGDLCSCNPRNGGSGICGCVIANNPVEMIGTYEYVTDLKL